MNRRLISSACAACSLVMAAAVLVAQGPKAAAPVLVTSCGQSPGGMMMKVALQRAGVAHEYKDQATAQDVAGKKFKSVIVVTGASLKGMGAAGVSMKEELARTDALIAEARKQGMTVIGAHVEGMSRRAQGAAPGDNSDEQSIDAVCPKSSLLIVKKEGDSDGRFTTISKSKNIQMLGFEKNMDLVALLTGLFK